MTDPAVTLLSREWAKVALHLRTAFSPAHPSADIFHPPYPPIVSQSISRDVPLARARASCFLLCNIALSLLRESPDCPSLRASDEHSFIVRVLRARRMVWRLPSHPSEAARCASMGEHLALLASILWRLDRPRPLPFGQRHFLKPTVRPLKLARLVHLHNKRVCLMRLPSKPVSTGGARFRLGPLIARHSLLSFS